MHGRARIVDSNLIVNSLIKEYRLNHSEDDTRVPLVQVWIERSKGSEYSLALVAERFVESRHYCCYLGALMGY